MVAAVAAAAAALLLPANDVRGAVPRGHACGAGPRSGLARRRARAAYPCGASVGPAIVPEARPNPSGVNSEAFLPVRSLIAPQSFLATAIEEACNEQAFVGRVCVDNLPDL